MLASGASAAACSVSYKVASQWGDGFQGVVAVTNNRSTALSGWKLAFTFGAGQKVSRGWNAEWKQSGKKVTVTNTASNDELAAGAAVSTGFLASWSGSNPAPKSFKLNGRTCDVVGAATPSASADVTPTFSESTSPTPTPTATASTSLTPTVAADGWNPPADLAQPLDEVWKHVESTYSDLYGFKNYGWDQLMATKGTVNYCVRWDSDNPVTATTRDKIHTALRTQFNKWIHAMVDDGKGYSSFPYTDVKVDVVGWAVKNRSTLQWSDDSVKVYAGVLDDAGAPQCAPDCGRFFHQDGDYSRCPGKEAEHYDESLWLTKGFEGGAGGDWGQRVGQEYFTGALDQENIHIYLHEVGHTFGLDDFYDWTPTGVSRFIMNAGSATEITTFDQWMLRDFWRHLKSRYGY
ncbi:cellulose-binding protein [Streptomyces sp. S3(2020)]|uniref:cellulose-binding domain-containing protein n=1 Tax=Streptomyces sp. S3(2020) TaxID=2732044 RepID=UPI001488F412|nr:cellulose-binding domain-containing protein [Streptomyces sp. S3(2020)]NNN34452.1 cellulose-binding protein [Streptomyces sp. S3(2020)]